MSSLSANRTLLLMKSRKRLLTGSHCIARSFVSDNKSPIAQEAGRLLMLQFKTFSVMGSKDFLTRSSGRKLCSHERNVSICAVDELQREGHWRGTVHHVHGRHSSGGFQQNPRSERWSLMEGYNININGMILKLPRVLC